MLSRRILLCGLLASTCALPLAAANRLGLTGPERNASIAYINSLQNGDGGFRPTAAPGKSALSAMPSSLRALHHLGGDIKHKHKAEQFIESCYHEASGAFSDTPDGTPDVRSTSMGLMSLAELKVPVGDKQQKIVRYFEEHARDLGDFYISEAAMDAAGIRPEHPRRWIEEFDRTRNADGTYGKTAAETARGVVTRMRLKEEVPHRESVVLALLTAQNADGGWSATGTASDLATCYPVMRALFMLNQREQPTTQTGTSQVLVQSLRDERQRRRLMRVRGFVASCRNADGGYGPTPGKPSTSAATYQASIILHWLDHWK